MNHKQKLGYMALGAGVLALGIIIGQWVTPDIEAQNNGVFDEVTCRKLRVVDENGKLAVVLSSDKGPNSVIVVGVNDEPAIVLLSDKDSSGVLVHDPQGNQAIVLGSSPTENTVFINDKQGEGAVSLRSDSEVNAVYVHDKQGESTAVGLQSAPEANGVLVTDSLTGEVKMLD